MNKNIRINGKKHLQYLDKKKRECFKSKLEQMEIAYSNNEAKKCYQEVNSIRKGFKLQTLLVGDNKVTS